MDKNVLLSFMILCYLLPIIFVKYNYTSNNSVSNIICDNKCKHYILVSMFLIHNTWLRFLIQYLYSLSVSLNILVFCIITSSIIFL